MVVVSFEGGLGSGKTLGMTYMLYLEWKLMGRRIYANYHLNFPHEKLDLRDLLENLPQLNDVAIGADELYIVMDSRLSVSKRNRLLSYFALQTRKRNVTLYFTTQFLDQVDKRLRRLVDYRIMCERVGESLFKYTVFNLQSFPPSMHQFYLLGERVWHLYDTTELIDFTEDLESDNLKALKKLLKDEK